MSREPSDLPAIERRGLLKKALAFIAGGVALGSAMGAPRRKPPRPIPTSARSCCSPATSCPGAGPRAMGSCCRSTRTRRCFPSCSPVMAGTARRRSPCPTCVAGFRSTRARVRASPTATSASRAVRSSMRSPTPRCRRTRTWRSRTTASARRRTRQASCRRRTRAVPHYGAGADVTLAANAVGAAGGDQPHNNMQPYLTIMYCIALQGAFPVQE